MTIPLHTLNSGYKIPAIGFGTMQIPNEKLLDSLKCALDSGYRLFDGAGSYGNEKEIGEAFKTIFAEGKYKREDIFYTSKLTNNNHSAANVAKACRNTLQSLQFPYLDLYLVHWPMAVTGNSHKSLNEKGKGNLDRIPLSETWKAMELLVKEGLVKSIGVSNQPVVILNDLLSYATIPPATNQVEIHPFNQRKNLVDFCNDNHIHMTSYFPSARYGMSQDAGIPTGNKKPFPSVNENPMLVELAKKYNKTPSQIAMRWNIQRKIKDQGGNYLTPDTFYQVSIIPRSSNPTHIKENIDIVDFALSDEELDRIEGLEQGYRISDPKIIFGFPVWD